MFCRAVSDKNFTCVRYVFCVVGTCNAVKPPFVNALQDGGEAKHAKGEEKLPVWASLPANAKAINSDVLFLQRDKRILS